MRLPSHHGAASSSLTSTTSHLTTRLRRLNGGFLHRSRNFKVGPGQRKRGFSSSAASKGGFMLRRSSPKMASSGKPEKGTWHFSHGFVFANDTKVVYPRLPSMRQYGASALAPRDDGASAAGVTDVEVAGAGGQKTAVVDAASVGGGTSVVAVAETAAAVAGEGESAEKAVPETSTTPFQPLAFKIPDDVFEAARNAPEGSPQSFWSYNLYRGPSGEDDTPTKVKVHYCTSEHTTERVLRQYFMDEKLLGFDLEWEISATKKQGVRRNVSLFQLASETRIALFHLALYPKKDSFVAPALREIMENPEVTKAGVWIKGDASRVRNFMGVECRGLFELSHLYRLVEWCSTSGVWTKKPGKKLVRMATQVEDYLGLPLYKGPDVRTSDWSQALGMDQIIYSASDAYAAIHLYAAMNHARLALDPVPPLPYHAELDLPIRLADNVALSVEDDAQEQPLDEDAAPQTFAEYAELLSANHSVEIQDEDMAELGEQFLTTKKTPPKRKTAAKKPAAPQPPRDPRVEEAELWAKQRIAARTTTAAAAEAGDGGDATMMEMADTEVEEDATVAATMTTFTETEDGGSATTTTMAASTETKTSKTRSRLAGKGGATMYMLRAYYLWFANEDLDIDGVAGLLRDPPLARSTVAGYIIGSIQAENLPYDKVRMLEGMLEKLPPDMMQYRYKGILGACRRGVKGANERE